MTSPSLALLLAPVLIDPTFLRQEARQAPAALSALTTSTCRSHPLFGEGAPHASAAKGLARFVRIELDGDGKCAEAAFSKEEQAWFVTRGEGSLTHPGGATRLRKDEFVYLPPGARFQLQAGAEGLEAIVMGYRVPADKVAGTSVEAANAGDVKQQVVGNHPPSTLYRLLMGSTRSTRDRIAVGAVLTSLFIMDIAPGGTNHPHHHDTEEEVYLLLEGTGEMVAGGGSNGVEGRFPAKAGDAYFFRLNTTVGFYNTGSKPARILAVRSLYPFRR